MTRKTIHGFAHLGWIIAVRWIVSSAGAADFVEPLAVDNLIETPPNLFDLADAVTTFFHQATWKVMTVLPSEG